jgi:uncharacterized protein YebE (UPF0316 family)
MDIFLSPEAWLGAGLIFLLRVTDMSLDTMRVLFVMRGKRGIVWILGFFQAAIFIVAIGIVLSDLDSVLKVIGYAAGFATGNVVGMLIEEKLAVGFIQLRIISPRLGSAIAGRLREDGFAVTEVPARGKDGMVALLHCSVRRKRVEHVRNIINQIDPTAFITAEDVRPVRRGFWRA